MTVDIPQTRAETVYRLEVLSATITGGLPAAEVIYRDITAAVVAATRFDLQTGGVGWSVNEAQEALREGWTVFWGVWIQTSDLEQSMAQLDGYLAQDPDARALGGDFYLYGWELERNKRLPASLGKRRGDPAA